MTLYEERGILKGQRQLILSQLQHEFGAIPDAIAAKVQAMQTEVELTALSYRLLDARSLADLVLEDTASSSLD